MTFDKQQADKLIAMMEGCDGIISSAKKKKDEYELELMRLLSPDVAEVLNAKEYGCGTVTLDTETKQIKVVVSKRVKWDQSKLSTLWDDIEASGEKPAEYIKLKYDVSEEAYKNWPSSIQKAFEPARTVEVSKPSIAIKERKI